MNEQDRDAQNHSTHDEQDRPDGKVQPPSFWRSRTGLVLIVALVVAGVLLGYEHRVHIFESGWLLWGLLLLCVGSHFFMHGGHGGGHGGHGSGDDRS